MVEKDCLLYTSNGEDYKVELIEELPEGEVISFYKQGDFADWCRGPHLPSTKKVKAVKLLSVAGAYWRGDEKNKMLQRIYGLSLIHIWVNDESFNQSTWEGLQKAEEKYGSDKVKVKYLESTKDADYVPNIETFVEEDLDLIIGVGYKTADAVSYTHLCLWQTTRKCNFINIWR